MAVVSVFEKEYFLTIGEIALKKSKELVMYMSSWTGNILLDMVIVLVIIVAVVIFGLLVFGIVRFFYTTADSWHIPQLHDMGKITAKFYQPAHSISSHIMVNGISLPQSNYHEEEWIVQVEIKKEQGEISVSKAYFDSIELGNHVNVDYFSGRFSRKLYLKTIYSV